MNAFEKALKAERKEAKQKAKKLKKANRKLNRLNTKGLYEYVDKHFFEIFDMRTVAYKNERNFILEVGDITYTVFNKQGRWSFKTKEQRFYISKDKIICDDISDMDKTIEQARDIIKALEARIK